MISPISILLYKLILHLKLCCRILCFGIDSASHSGVYDSKLLINLEAQLMLKAKAKSANWNQQEKSLVSLTLYPDKGKAHCHEETHKSFQG